jgi:hypothetical protein
MKEGSLKVARTTKKRKQRPRRVFTLAAPSSWRARRMRSGERLLYAPLFAAFSFAGEYKPPFRSAEASLSRIPMWLDMGVKVHSIDGRDWIGFHRWSAHSKTLGGWGKGKGAFFSLAWKEKTWPTNCALMTFGQGYVRTWAAFVASGWRVGHPPNFNFVKIN